MMILCEVKINIFVYRCWGKKNGTLLTCQQYKWRTTLWKWKSGIARSRLWSGAMSTDNRVGPLVIELDLIGCTHLSVRILALWMAGWHVSISSHTAVHNAKVLRWADASLPSGNERQTLDCHVWPEDSSGYFCVHTVLWNIYSQYCLTDLKIIFSIYSKLYIFYNIQYMHGQTVPMILKQTKG